MGCLTGCISGILKYILFIFNVLLLLCGIVILVFGILYLKANNLGVSVEITYRLGGLAVFIGSFIALIAFIGCCGAFLGNSCLLSTYIGILLGLCVLQVILGVLAFTGINNRGNSFNKSIEESVEKLFRNYDNKDKMDLINNLQKDLKCCGVTSSDFWKGDIPASCCGRDSGACLPADAYDKGCADAFADYLRETARIIGGTSFGFGAVELVAAIVAYIVKKG